MYKRNQIHFFYFPFWLSVTLLMKPISLKCIGHGSRYKGIDKCKLKPVYGLSLNTLYNFFPTEYPCLWKGYGTSTDFPRCFLFKRQSKNK